MSTGPWGVKSARNLLIGRTVSSAGGMAQVTGGGWWVLQQTGSAAAVGVLVALRFAPKLVGSPVGGWMADRHDIRKLAVLLNTLQSIPPLVIGLQIWDNEMSLPWIYALVFIGAVPGSLASPLSQLLIPMTVPAQMRPAAITDSSVACNLAYTLGPLVGSGLVAYISVGGTFVVNAVSFWFYVWAIQRAVLVTPPHRRTQRADRTSYLTDVRRGWASAIARAALMGALMFFGLVAPIQQLLPSLAATHGESVAHLGFLLSAIAFGGVAASPFIKRRLGSGREVIKLITVGLVIGGPTLVALGFSSNLGVDIGLLLLLGSAWECLWIASQTALQLHLPAEITGPMIGLFFSVTALGTALGSILLGRAIDWFGVRTSLATVGLLVLSYGILQAIKKSDP